MHLYRSYFIAVSHTVHLTYRPVTNQFKPDCHHLSCQMPNEDRCRREPTGAFRALFGIRSVNFSMEFHFKKRCDDAWCLLTCSCGAQSPPRPSWRASVPAVMEMFAAQSTRLLSACYAVPPALQVVKLSQLSVPNLPLHASPASHIYGLLVCVWISCARPIHVQAKNLCLREQG